MKTLTLLLLLATFLGPLAHTNHHTVKWTGPSAYAEGPCKAIHYGRPGYKREVSMEEVVWNRQYASKHIIKGFKPRSDVVGFMAVKNVDQWRIKHNHRALVQFKTPYGYSQPMWMQPADYQKKSDMTSSQCRTEISEKLARSMGWSWWQGWGRMDSWIIRWEGK